MSTTPSENSAENRPFIPVPTPEEFEQGIAYVKLTNPSAAKIDPDHVNQSPEDPKAFHITDEVIDKSEFKEFT